MPSITLQKEVGGEFETMPVIGRNGWRIVLDRRAVQLVPVHPSPDSGLELPEGIPPFESARIARLPSDWPKSLGEKHKKEAKGIMGQIRRAAHGRKEKPSRRDIEAADARELMLRHDEEDDLLAIAAVWNCEALDSGEVKYRADFTATGATRTFWLSDWFFDGLTPEDAAVITANRTDRAAHQEPSPGRATVDPEFRVISFCTPGGHLTRIPIEGTLIAKMIRYLYNRPAKCATRSELIAWKNHDKSISSPLEDFRPEDLFRSRAGEKILRARIVTKTTSGHATVFALNIDLEPPTTAA